jgi:hypothetical protein
VRHWKQTDVMLSFSINIVMNLYDVLWPHTRSSKLPISAVLMSSGLAPLLQLFSVMQFHLLVRHFVTTACHVIVLTFVTQLWERQRRAISRVSDESRTRERLALQVAERGLPEVCHTLVRVKCFVSDT